MAPPCMLLFWQLIISCTRGLVRPMRVRSSTLRGAISCPEHRCCAMHGMVRRCDALQHQALRTLSHAKCCVFSPLPSRGQEEPVAIAHK